MNLWIASQDRCHGTVTNAVCPEPPRLPGWPSHPDLLDKSNEIDHTRVLSPELIAPDGEPFVNERDYAQSQRGAFLDGYRSVGTEAVAFYAPVHFFGETRWGIYLHIGHFLGACAELAGRLGSPNWDDIVTDAFHAVERHEFFHAAVELFSLVLEDFGYLRCAAPDFDEGTGLLCPYELYSNNVYRRDFPTSKCLEEALATRSEFQSRFRTAGFGKVLAQMIKSAPPAYQEWEAYKTAGRMRQGIMRLAETIIGETLPAAKVKAKFSSPYSAAVWFPALSPDCLDVKGPVPRRVYSPDGVRIGRFVESIFGNYRIEDALRTLKREFGAEVIPGGKHPAIRFRNGRKVPFSRSWVTVPNYWIGQVAAALGVRRREIRDVLL